MAKLRRPLVSNESEEDGLMVVPEVALPYFSNPLLLVQSRPQLEAVFARVPGGAALLQTLFTNVKISPAVPQNARRESIWRFAGRVMPGIASGGGRM